MSYASETKRIITSKSAGSWCCKVSELCALICFGATYKNGVLTIKSETEEVFNRLLDLCDEALNILKQKITIPEREGQRYIFTLKDHDEIARLCEFFGFPFDGKTIIFSPDKDIYESDCCKVSFIRGAYIMAGSVSNPEKNYHLEFVTKHAKAADLLYELLSEADILSRLTVRKNSFVIYIKEFEAIAEIMGLLGAGSMMMDLYNIKIEREVRNKVNRVVNCDNANIKKITSAAEAHLDAINKIIAANALDKLSDTLKEIAVLRLENPDLSLSELGMLLDPPIGKSGVNHRLSRLVAFSENLN